MDFNVDPLKTGEKYHTVPFVQYNEVEHLKKPEKCYKPSIHRTSCFALFFVVAIALIGVVEYACRSLPQTSWRNMESVAKNHLHGRDELHARQTRVGSANPNFYLNTALETTKAPSALPPASYLQSTIAVSTNPSAYLVSVTSATKPSAYLNPSITSSSSSYAPMTSDSGSKVFATPPSAYLDPSTTVNPVSNTPHPTTLSAEPTSAYLDPAIARTSSFRVSTSSTSSSYRPVKTASSSVLEPSTGKHPPLKNLTQAKYFVGAYLPTLLAVLFRISVGSLYAATKMMEPFFSLARTQGTTPKNFFHINYLSTNDTFDPIMAMFSGHWLMLWTSILYTAVGLMTPFASELLHFARYCDVRQVCGPELRINPDIARILQALLAFTAVMLINVWWLQRKHSSGIYSDPSSIASLTSLLHHPEVLADFQRIHPDASKDEMLKAVKGKRYRLDIYRAADGSERYGLVPLGGTSNEHDKAQQPFLGQNTDPAVRDRAAKQHHTKRMVRDVIFGLVTLAMLIIVTYYYKVGSDSGFERFMDSQTFGPRFVFAIVGILIHSQWKRLERESAILEPFRQLQKGAAQPHSSILTTRTLSPLTTLPIALYRSNFFVAHIAFVALLAEALIIVLSGIPFSAGQLHTAFVVSAYLCMAILAYMLLTLTSVWTRSKGPGLPRTPNTLASVWSYVCGSRMAGDFSELSVLGTAERDRVVAGWGRVYGLKKVRGVDGVMRWGVDYDDGEGRSGV